MRGRFAAIGACFLVLSSASAPAGAATKEPAKPSIEIPRIVQDFGDVFERATYEYAFVVRNRGQANLVIESVKPGCGCTVAEFDSVIAPGKEGQIKLVLDGNRVHGKFEKSASVKTNDPDHSELTITLAGNEIPYVNIKPEGTIYLHGRWGEKIEKSVTLTSNEKDRELKVTGVSSNIDDKITYSFEPGPKKGEYTINVKKNPDLPTSSAYGNLTVHTNSEKNPDTILQVHVMTKGSISVSPSTLNYGAVDFGEDKDGEPVTRSIMILKTDGEFQIKSVEVSNEHFSAKLLDPVLPGKQYKVEVTFVPPPRREVRQREIGELVVNTDDPREPSVRVNLIARASK
jgi:Protein of unknown function (DUF1573)